MTCWCMQTQLPAASLEGLPVPNYPSSCSQWANGESQVKEQRGEYEPRVPGEEEEDGITPSPSCALAGLETAPAAPGSTQANDFTTTLC